MVDKMPMPHPSDPNRLADGTLVEGHTLNTPDPSPAAPLPVQDAGVSMTEATAAQIGPASASDPLTAHDIVTGAPGEPSNTPATVAFRLVQPAQVRDDIPPPTKAPGE